MEKGSAVTFSFYPEESKFNQIKKVIKSCINWPQLYSAKNYVNNALNSEYIQYDTYIDLLVELQKHTIKFKL